MYFQPPRTKHCHDCDKCVLQFDHHCVWLGTCIGQGNHCRFWWVWFCQLLLVGSYPLIHLVEFWFILILLVCSCKGYSLCNFVGVEENVAHSEIMHRSHTHYANSKTTNHIREQSHNKLYMFRQCANVHGQKWNPFFLIHLFPFLILVACSL